MTLGPRVFLGTEGFPATVYDAQVLDLLRALDGIGLRFDLVNYDPLLPRTLASAEGRARVERLRAALPGGLFVRPFVPWEDRIGAPQAVASLRALLGDPPRLIHARGLLAAWLACRAAGRRDDVAVIWDARGDTVAEHRFHHGGHGAADAPGLARVLRMEGEVAARAARVFAVSQALVDALAARHPQVSGKARVFPCACDTARFRPDPAARARWRAELGLEERWVLVYAGSLIPYQLPERVAIAGRIAHLAGGTDRPPAHLLLLTPDVVRAATLLQAADLPPGSWTVRAAGHAEMPGLLAAADAGLLLRRRDPVNAVASPTKLAEYLAVGLPVLVSEGIGDLSGWVAREGLGQVLADPDDDVALLHALQRLREAPPDPARVAALAREQLGRERFLPAYREEYAALTV